MVEGHSNTHGGRPDSIFKNLTAIQIRTFNEKNKNKWN